MPKSKETPVIEAVAEGSAPVKVAKETEPKKDTPEEFLRKNIKADSDVRVTVKKIAERTFRVNYLRLTSIKDLQVKDWRMDASFFLEVVDTPEGMKIMDRTIQKPSHR